MADDGRKLVNYKQIGISGLRRSGPYIYEEFLPELRWPRAGKIYQEMSDNDAVIGSILYLAEMLIRGATWSVEPGGKSAADVEAAEFLQSCMHDMEDSWANTISEILSMLTYGFSFHEIVYKIRRGPMERSPKYRSQYTDGRIGWRKIPVRSQISLDGWEFNSDGDASAFLQVPEPDYILRTIPLSKGLLFRTKVSRNNPEGKSLLRNAYRSWFFKKHFEEIEGIGIERDLAGFPVLHPPEGMDLWNDADESMVALRARAEELVASVRRDSQEGVLLPFGWELSLLTSGSTRQIDIGSTIERYDKRIAITMLSDLVLLGEKSGSFALADTKQSTLAAALQAQVQNIADVFNSNAVRQLFLMNRFDGMTKLPMIVPGQIQTPSLKELALILRAMGLKIAGDRELMNYLRKVTGMPDLSEEDFKEIYGPQAAKAEPTPDPKAPNPNKDPKSTNPDDTQKPDDTVDNDFEQNDMNNV